MQQLNISFQETICHSTSIGVIADRLNRVGKQQLSYAPWAATYPYKPDVQFAVAYGPDCLFLQYEVKETVVQAAHGRPNDPVYQDSCVEAFISFDDGSTYYNFEFNCIGTVLAGYGKSRNSRQWLPEEALHAIQWQAVIGKDKRDSLVKWTLTLSLPFEVFIHHRLPSLQGQQCRANFYKCGDSLPEPHFLSWSDIQSKEPDFHLPQFFGTLLFE